MQLSQLVTVHPGPIPAVQSYIFYILRQPTAPNPVYHHTPGTRRRYSAQTILSAPGH